MTVLLGLRNRIVFQRCLWVSGLPGVHIKCTPSPAEEHSQVAQRCPPQTDFKTRKSNAGLQSHSDRASLTKRLQRASCAMEKYQVHTETHRWRKNNPHGEISKRTCAHWKVSYVLQEKTREANLYQHLRQQKSPRSFSVIALPQNVDVVSWPKHLTHLSPLPPTHQLCSGIFLFQTHRSETATFVSARRRLSRPVLKKRGQLQL